jgi:Transposase DDE domain group 1
MGRLETEWLATDANLEALTDLSGAWIDRVHERKPPDSLILDMDSSESPTHGEQEGLVWNGHFGCTCYHPLFVFNQYGDLERCRLRPGNVHSAEDWRLVLEPVIARYRERGVDLYFRADAAFAKPKIYELLEAEGIRYAIRLPANQVLQRRIVHLLTRPVGHPRSRSCPTPASTTRPPAGPEPVGSWPRSSGTRANSTQGSASSSIYDAGFPVITKVMILPPYGRVAIAARLRDGWFGRSGLNPRKREKTNEEVPDRYGVVCALRSSGVGRRTCQGGHPARHAELDPDGQGDRGRVRGGGLGRPLRPGAGCQPRRPGRAVAQRLRPRHRGVPRRVVHELRSGDGRRPLTLSRPRGSGRGRGANQVKTYGGAQQSGWLAWSLRRPGGLRRARRATPRAIRLRARRGGPGAQEEKSPPRLGREPTKLHGATRGSKIGFVMAPAPRAAEERCSKQAH